MIYIFFYLIFYKKIFKNLYFGRYLMKLWNIKIYIRTKMTYEKFLNKKSHFLI